MVTGFGACSPGMTELPSTEEGNTLGEAGGHMCQTSSGDIGQMGRYTNLDLTEKLGWRSKCES